MLSLLTAEHLVGLVGTGGTPDVRQGRQGGFDFMYAGAHMHTCTRARMKWRYP